MESWLHNLKELHESIPHTNYIERDNLFILETFQELLKDITMSDIEDYVSNNYNFISDVIWRKSKSFYIYRQPVVLLLFYLIDKWPVKTRMLWPLPDSHLHQLFTDMGIAFNDPGE